MGKNLTIPKRGDLVVCVRGGFIGEVMHRRPLLDSMLKEGDMGLVTFTRHSPEGSGGSGYLTIKWFSGITSKHALDGKWARTAHGWKQWLRVAEHKQV
jgi:hypothetical protein